MTEPFDWKALPVGYSAVLLPDLFDTNRLGDQVAITEKQAVTRLQEFLNGANRFDIEIGSVVEIKVAVEEDKSGAIGATRTVRLAIVRRRGEEEV